MKGEYVEPSKPNPNDMFSNLRQHQTHHFSHHFQLSRDSRTPDSDDATHTPSHGPKDLSTTHSPSLPSGGSGTRGGANSGGDGASIEIVRRPRGRPPGSKNKPKPSVVITHEPEPAMSPYILEIPGGNDIVEAVARFSRHKNIGICVLTGSGTVSNVSLRQPSSATPGGTITFHGRFDILSLSATFPAQTTSCHVPNTIPISLAGHQGQIVGGFVAGPLVAASNVFLVAATFNNPSYHRLPREEEEGRNTVSSGGAGGQSPPLSGGGGDSSHGGGADSCGVPMYNSHMAGSDVIWAPTARPPPPPPPY
ncbi:AT-hook motif nuclear-localized protein 17 [Hibiscus syriacus]|uniref:AT-hook motif nuclear-localized protein n=1 Tax=Hibiscus syriacus TaxID=106335 RepID=A0A6A2XX65_HIBSY|nr:AT-hook motif nuclear-localized protein 28-like [Hibiscus syriacus]KAE8666766.1 AT-hook motif nuclear-localized protein 17 [Hibiscus syriacus]